MASPWFTISLPEWENKFLKAMAGALPKEVMKVNQAYTIPHLGPLTMNGQVVPDAEVKIYINGHDQFPTTTITADPNGNFTVQITLLRSQNEIKVSYFPPEFIVRPDQNFQMTMEIDLEHVGLFSPYLLGSTVNALTIYDNLLYIGGTSTVGADYLIARHNMTTGAIIRLSSMSSPIGVKVADMHIDLNWLYIAAETNEVTRYAKDLSAKTSLALTSRPFSIFSDGTNVYAIRNGTSPAVVLHKINPSTWLEISNASISEGASAIEHHGIANVSTDIAFPHSFTNFGEAGGDTIEQGVPAFTDLVTGMRMFHKRVRKSDLVVQATTELDFHRHDADDLHLYTNSLVYTGGKYYTLVQSDPGKILEMTESGTDMVVSKVIPLPFSTRYTSIAYGQNVIQQMMKLGSDGNLYIAGESGFFARTAPGSTTVRYIERGMKTVAVSSTHVATIDDSFNKRAVGAPSSIFVDRGTDYIVPSPTAPTNVRCHYNVTQTWASIGWDAGQGNGYIVEMAVDEGFGPDSFIEMGRDYIGHSFLITTINAGRPFWTRKAGDILIFRVKAVNAAGESGYSTTAQVVVPFRYPAMPDPTSLVITGSTGTSVSLQWNPNYDSRWQTVRIYRSENGSDFTQIHSYILTSGATQTYTDNTTSGLTQYWFKVRNTDVSYYPSNYSNTVDLITPEDPPAAPTGVAIKYAWEGTVVDFTYGVGGGEPDSATALRNEITADGTVTYPTNRIIDTAVTRLGGGKYKVKATNTGGIATSSASADSILWCPKVEAKSGTSSNETMTTDSSYVYLGSNDADGDFSIERFPIGDSLSSTSFKISTGNKMPGGCVRYGTYMFACAYDYVAGVSYLDRIDLTTMSRTHEVSLGMRASNASFATDGSNYWVAVSNPLSPYTTKVFRFDPADASILQTKTYAANIRSIKIMYFSAGLFMIYRNISTFLCDILRLDTSTLDAVETVPSGGGFSIDMCGAMVNDGSKIYANGGSSGNGILARFTTGPLAFETQSAAGFSPTVFGGLAYDGSYLYTVLESSTGGYRKFDPSTLSQVGSSTFYNPGTPGQIEIQGDYVFCATSNSWLMKDDKTTF
jgi:hypothetical protein